MERAMAIFDEIKKPTKINLLICFCDLARFLDVGKRIDGLELFELMNGMATTTIRYIKTTPGRVIKFIGDSAFIVFPEEHADDGIRSMLELRTLLINYFSGSKIDIKMHFGIHFGEVVVGPFGEEPMCSLDVLGDNVNRAAMLAGSEYKGKFVITPQVFRELKPQTRTLFYKHAPPVVYVAE
jgi:adenylate cyclase